MKEILKEKKGSKKVKKQEKASKKEQIQKTNEETLQKEKHGTKRKRRIKITKKNKKSSTVKTGIIVLEIIILLILGKLTYDILTRPVEKTEEELYDINLTVDCDFSNPWLPVYEESGDLLIELGQKREFTDYTFVIEEARPTTSEMIETVKYTTVEAFEKDKDFCNTLPYGEAECTEDKEKLIRTVKVNYIYFKSLPEQKPYYTWAEEYIDELEEVGYSCKITENK